MRTWYKNLGEFIQALKDAGELKVINETVSPYLEISKYTDAESKSPHGGKALLFPNVQNSEFPVATNLFGSTKRICMALGVKRLDDLGDRIRKIIDTKPPSGMMDMMGLLPTALSISRSFPKRTKNSKAPCQDVVHLGDNVDLHSLPVLHCWPKDGGPFVTLPLVITKSPVTGRTNMGMYRLQVFDRNTTGMHWHIHKDGSHYYQEYRRANKRMPTAVAIGCDPATIYAATAPMPRNVDELILAGFIRNKPVETVRGITVDLDVPAEADFVLEGYVNPDELRLEGPFGDHTGYYSLADDYPVFHVTAITHRKNPKYCATLVGRPPMEDCYLAKATERIFLPLLQMVFPEIKDYWLPWEGVFHNAVVVAIEKEYPGQAQKIMHGLWGQSQMSFCKTIIVVDGNVNLNEPVEVFELFLRNFNAAENVVSSKGVLDVLDHSAPAPIFGSKIGIDLTSPMPGEPERGGRIVPSMKISEADDALNHVKEKTAGVAGALHLNSILKMTDAANQVMLLNVEKTNERNGRYFAEKLFDNHELAEFSIFVMYDPDIDLRDGSLLLWKLFNNVDPQRDIIEKSGRITVDACKKGPMDGHHREWPEDLTFDVDP